MAASWSKAVTDTASRAAWTAAETFFAVWAASGMNWADVTVLKAAGLAAGAAALSVVKNGAAHYARSRAASWS